MRARVQIARKEFRDLCGDFLEKACHRSAESLAAELFRLPYEPYAPVRRQQLNLLRLINKKRQHAGFEKLSPSVLRYKRRIVLPFDAARPVEFEQGGHLEAGESRQKVQAIQSDATGSLNGV